MGRYGWLRNGELQYEMALIVLHDDKRGPFGESGSARQYFAECREKGKSVGVIILPHGIRTSMSFLASTAHMLGVNQLVPDHIDEVVVVRPSEIPMKFDLRRKMLAYGNVEILLDLEFGGECTMDCSKFSCAQDGTWTVDAELLVPDSEIARAYSAAAALADEDDLIHATLGIHTYPCTDLLRDIKDCKAEQEREEVLSEFMENRAKSVMEARRMYQVFTFDMLGDPPIGDSPGNLMERMLSALPEDTGFARWDYMGKSRTCGWVLENKHAYDAKTISLESFCPSTMEEREYSVKLKKAEEHITTCRKIWDDTLWKENCPLVVPPNVLCMEATEQQREMAANCMKHIGEDYGIKYIVESYAKGVPLEDIYA